MQNKKQYTIEREGQMDFFDNYGIPYGDDLSDDEKDAYAMAHFYQNFFTENIKCPYCKHIRSVNLEDYVIFSGEYGYYDEDEDDEGMGPESVYDIDSKDEYVCPHCGKTVHIEGWIREYPMGAYDSSEIYVSKTTPSHK